MPDNSKKRCPQCGGEIDYFGSCRRCGREWSESLEEEELAEGLKEGEQHPSVVKPSKKKPTRTKHTKNSSPKESSDRYSLWRIDASNDDETEIIRKRSLMHLDSRKTYNEMGLALRAHEAQKASLLWLSRLWELLSEDEKTAIGPALEHLKRGYADLKLVAQAKVNEAARMEMALEKEHKAARQARIRIMGEQAKKRAEDESRSKVVDIQPHEDTEGFGVPDPVTLDPKTLEQLTPDDLMELAKAKLANLDQEKALRKNAERLADDNTPDEE